MASGGICTVTGARGHAERIKEGDIQTNHVYGRPCRKASEMQTGRLGALSLLLGVLRRVPVLLVRLGQHLCRLAELHDVDDLLPDHDRTRDGGDDERPRDLFDRADDGDRQGQDEPDDGGWEDGQGREEGLVVVGENVERDEKELVRRAEDEERVLSRGSRV